MYPYDFDPNQFIRDALALQQGGAPQMPTMTPAGYTNNPFQTLLYQSLAAQNNLPGLLAADTNNPALRQAPWLQANPLAMPSWEAISLGTIPGPGQYVRFTPQWEAAYREALRGNTSGATSGILDAMSMWGWGTGEGPSDGGDSGMSELGAMADLAGMEYGGLGADNDGSAAGTSDTSDAAAGDSGGSDTGEADASAGDSGGADAW